MPRDTFARVMKYIQGIATVHLAGPHQLLSDEFQYKFLNNFKKAAYSSGVIPAFTRDSIVRELVSRTSMILGVSA